jgi:hypothetical protein
VYRQHLVSTKSDTQFFHDYCAHLLAISLQEYLFCAQVPGLLEVAEDAIPTLIRKFEELVDGGDYTHWPCSKEAFDTVLDEVQHLQQAHEDEFMISRSALHHVQETEYTEPDQVSLHWSRHAFDSHACWRSQWKIGYTPVCARALQSL